ncbi:Protein of unknown function [Gryllus bimaculatus]|nr:Protein of unknown function [Gryllus bimaculatus]
MVAVAAACSIAAMSPRLALAVCLVAALLACGEAQQGRPDAQGRHDHAHPRPRTAPTAAARGRRRAPGQLPVPVHAGVQPGVRLQRRHLQQPHQAPLRPALRIRGDPGVLRAVQLS